jgi:tetratricopeptide (TPR) repeat protein
MHGLVRVEKGEIEAGIRQSEAALETLKSVPSRRFHLPIRIGIVGLAKAGGGDRDGALTLFDSALEAAATTGERWYEPELLRLKADMLVARSKQRSDEAERCLKAAIALAQQQKAKFWELRASTSLSRLWANQGRRTEAHALLTPVVEWFKQQPGSVDLKHATILLSDLV